MKFDAILCHRELSEMTGEHIHNLLTALFPGRNFYSHSVDWRRNRQYILKAKGTKGDVIIGWLENQAHNLSA